MKSSSQTNQFIGCAPGRRLLLFAALCSALPAACSEDDTNRFEVLYRSGTPRASGGASAGGHQTVDGSLARDGRAESGGAAGTGGTAGRGGFGGTETGGAGTGGVDGSTDAGPCGCGNIAPLVPCCTATGTCGFVVGAFCLPLFRDAGSGGRTGTGGAAPDAHVDAAADGEAGTPDASSDGNAVDAARD